MLLAVKTILTCFRRRLTLPAGLTCAALLVALGGCRLQPLTVRPPSIALTEAEAGATRLGAAVAKYAAASEGRTGVIPLRQPLDAFSTRMQLVAAAERTLDVQYYIWHRDLTGVLLLDALLDAAERGVRVRMLLDDHGTHDLDRELLALDAHENVEVRLFNPFRQRRFKGLGFVFEFSRVNRRMHNKSLSADSRLSILGGRNIGDVYFGAATGGFYADLDVLLAGGVVRDVVDDFDRYWASESAFPVEQVVHRQAEVARAVIDEALQEFRDAPKATSYLAALQQNRFVEGVLTRQIEVNWVQASLVSDDPAKALRNAEDGATTSARLREVIGVPQRSLRIVSPYFVPMRTGTDALVALARRGVAVDVLTNSLDATNVSAVHAAYSKRRRALLEGGVRLFEMRRLQVDEDGAPAGPLRQRIGSAGAALHAKTFSVDGERVYVGSFNFDPRSAVHNTELGVVLQSPDLSAAVDSLFTPGLRRSAYEVALDSGALRWTAIEGDSLRSWKREPRASWWRRTKARLLSFLPLDWLV